MQLIEQIQNKLKVESLSVLKMAKDTGISAYKIYKWLDGKGNPKAEDAKILAKWLNNDLEEVPSLGNTTANATPTLIERLLSERQILIDQIEARRQEMADRARRAEEQVDNLFQLLNGSISELVTNSKTNQQYLQKVLLVVRSDDSATHDSLDRLEHKPEGSNAKAAGKIELAAETQIRKTGKNNPGGGGRSHKQAKA